MDTLSGGPADQRAELAMPHRRFVHIVDDEVRIRDSLALLLSTAQIETRSYASAEEYLASARWDEPSCVVLDNQLPALSGIYLLKRIAIPSITSCDPRESNSSRSKLWINFEPPSTSARR